MALKKWEPLQELDDLLERSRRGFGILPWRNRDWMAELEWSPRVDIGEADGTYLIKAEIPGVKKDDVQVSIDNGILTLQGERKEEEESQGLQFHRVERFHGSFSRSFTLPADADEAGLKATAKEGQLTIEIPKKASAAGPPAPVQVPVT